MPDTRDDERRDEVRDEREENRKNNLGPWILGSAAVLAIPLLFCCFPRGCKRDCKDCNKPAPKKEIVVVKDTVIVEQYHVGGDMVNVNFTKGNGNNVASRNSGTQTWERATRPQPKKKTVVQPEPVVEPKPEPKPEPEPEIVEKHCTVVVTYQRPCNGR